MRLDMTAARSGITKHAPLQWKIFWILAAGRGRHWTHVELADIIWGEDAAGGPLWAGRSIHVTVMKIRAKLHAIDSEWAIHTIYAQGFELVRKC